MFETAVAIVTWFANSKLAQLRDPIYWSWMFKQIGSEESGEVDVFLFFFIFYLTVIVMSSLANIMWAG